MIPGRLRSEDMKPLAELVDGKRVLQLGCYCGRGLIVVADMANRTWVLDDFLCTDGIEGIVEELKANVDRLADPDDTINLLYGNVDGWSVPFGSEDLQSVDVVYRDADRPERERERDEQFALGILHDRGGTYIWHDGEHNLRWLKVEPVAVEVN